MAAAAQGLVADAQGRNLPAKVRDVVTTVFKNEMSVFNCRLACVEHDFGTNAVGAFHVGKPIADFIVDDVPAIVDAVDEFLIRLGKELPG